MYFWTKCLPLSDLQVSGLPSVAVVILSWNGRDYLAKFLPSVCRSTYSNLTIYVADNASTDGSMTLVESDFPQVRIIRNPFNNGFAGGYNEALKQVQAEYYVLLNQDVEVEPGWIEPVISLMQSRKQIAACQPKILSYHQKSCFEYAGAAGGWMDLRGYAFCRGRLFDTVEQDQGQYDQITDIFWASGAAMFIRSEVYHTLGGLDDFFFAHMEEIDLCWRIQLAGYKISFCPQSVVYHVGGGSLPRGNPRKTFLNYRNNLVMLAKNLPDQGKTATLFIRRVLDGIAALNCVLQGDFSDYKAIVQAHRAFRQWRRLHTASPIPSGITPVRDLKELSGVFQGSIIWEYFIKRKKRFSDLDFFNK